MVATNLDRIPTTRRRPTILLAVILSGAVLVAGCQPMDRTPGQWLSGTDVVEFPADWSFTDAIPEIAVEVSTPYFIPHSVTIWCAQVDGNLYIGARNPETKNWVGWMEKNRDIRLKIGEDVYAVTARSIEDEGVLDRVRAAYVDKYSLSRSGGDQPVVHYWSIAARG